MWCECILITQWKNTFIPGLFSPSVHSPRPCPHVFLLYLFYRLVIFFLFSNLFSLSFQFSFYLRWCCSSLLRSDLPFLPFSSLPFSFHPSISFLSAGSCFVSFLSVSISPPLFSLCSLQLSVLILSFWKCEKHIWLQLNHWKIILKMYLRR